jgi:hypothetical protein
MSITNTDSILWYNVGQFGEQGYAVPNWSDDIETNNVTIRELVDLVGSNLFLVMHGDDVRLSSPPFANTIHRIHQLYARIGYILQARARKESDLRFEAVHSTPAIEGFKVYPVPYFKVRNAWLKRWCELALRCIGEMMQHSENTVPDEISIQFAQTVGKYMNRIYVNMATELFGLTREVAEKEGFLLSPEQLAAYEPSKFVTSTERIDTVAPVRQILTEDAMYTLRSGILVSQLPPLNPYPSGAISSMSASGTATTPATGPIMPVP